MNLSELSYYCEKFELLLESNDYMNIVYQYNQHENDKTSYMTFLYTYNETPFKINVYFNDETRENIHVNLKCCLKYISFKTEFTIEDSFFNNSGLIRLNDIVSLFTNRILNIISENENSIKHILDEIENILKKEGE